VAITPEVRAAIDEINEAHPDATLVVKEDGQGGAMVIVEPVPLGTPYAHADTWVGFHITHLYPQPDIYPHHVRRDLARIDGQALGAATSISTFAGRESIQLSRRGNRWNSTRDTALLKMERVIDWLLAK
jgi:hypothetical protein